MNKGIIYVVGTPIGNLEDITKRAIRILGEVGLILCEDTRMTKRLLSAYNIGTPTLSYHTHSDDSRTKEIIERLRNGEKLALVSDAGTPGISDPGVALVSYIRKALTDDEVSIESVPGPSAVVTALSIAGVSTDKFIFLGFVPHKKGRETMFTSIKSYIDEDITTVFYESPHRIMKTLESLALHLSGTDCIVSTARELTKIHESVVQGDPQTVLKYFKDNEDKVRGEWVVIVSRARH